ncbi:MAG: hypothetical protein SH808_09240 [Saprospiraceae bacterium]|nr:hypothetical protein [Saprospiraceae bacterium]
MLSPKSNLWPAIAWGFVTTLVAFFLVHFVYYGLYLDGLDGYSRTKSEALQTAVFSFAYACLYIRASANWRANPESGFLNHKNWIVSSTSWKIPWLRIGNSLLFSGLTFLVILMALYLAGVVLSTVYVFVLEGIRGAVPPPDTRSSGALAVQIGLAGVVMEMGKTETQPRN